MSFFSPSPETMNFIFSLIVRCEVYHDIIIHTTSTTGYYCVCTTLLYCDVYSRVYIVRGKWSDFDCRDCHQLLFLLLHIALDNNIYNVLLYTFLLSHYEYTRTYCNLVCAMLYIIIHTITVYDNDWFILFLNHNSNQSASSFSF